MAIILWKSEDSFETINLLWSGGTTTSGVRLFADPYYTFIGGSHSLGSGLGISYITRVTTSGIIPSGLQAEAVNISPDGTTAERIEISTFYSEFGISYAIVAGESLLPQGQLFSSPFPGAEGAWTLANPVSGFIQDIVFPEYIDDPRFLAGISGAGLPRVQVIIASGDLSTRYATNWTTMVSGASVTDLEIIRLV